MKTNAHQASPKNGMFAIATAQLRQRYADAVMSDDNRTADVAREIGLLLGLTVAEIEADIRKAAEVKPTMAAYRRTIDEAEAAATDRPKLAKAASDASAKLTAAQTAYNVAQNALLQLMTFARKANESRVRIDRIEREHPRLFGRTP